MTLPCSREQGMPITQGQNFKNKETHKETLHVLLSRTLDALEMSSRIDSARRGSGIVEMSVELTKALLLTL